MLQDNPFADLIPGAGQPGVIYGPAETPKPVDPMEAESRRLENELKRQRLRKGDPMGEGEAKLREGEQNAAFLATNLVGNVNLLRDAIKTDPNASAPTWSQLAAGFLGQDVKNALLPEQRQVVENAQRLIVDSVLTLGTGAAYTPEQIEAYRRGMFPQVGDSQAAIDAKRQALATAMAAARVKAGGAAPKIDEAMVALGLDANPAIPLGTTNYVPEGDGPKGARATPEQEEALIAFARSHRGDPEAINAFAKANGFPYGVNAEELAGAGSIATGINYSKIDEAAEAQARDLIAKQDAAGARNPAQTLLDQGVTLGLSDQAAGIGQAVVETVKGGSPVEGYRKGRDAELLRIADARQQLGYGGTAIEMAGGFVSGRPTSVLAPFVSRSDTIIRGAREGAKVGALAGYGYGEGLEGSTVGTITGAGLGAGLGAGVSALSTRVGRAVDPALARAAVDEQVRAPRVLIEGSRGDIAKAGRLEADATTAPIIQQGFADVADDIGAGVERLGSGGTAQDRGIAGETFRQVAKDIQKADREGSTAAYSAAEAIQPDAVVDPVSMRAAIDRDLARLKRTPNSNEDQIRVLEKYRRDLENPLPLQAVRDLRTAARDNVSGLNIARSSGAKAADRRMMAIIDGSKDDIERALTPEAQAAWNAADKEFAENQTFYRQALKPFFGDDFDKLPADAIFDRIKGAANSNGRALAALHRRLTLEQSRNFAATIAEGLGKLSADEPFSAALFMQQARKFSPSARETIFGPSGKASFDNLLKLSRRLQAIQSEVNRSKTARPVGQIIREQAGNIITAILTGGGAISGGTAGAMGGAAGGIALSGAMNATSAIRRTLSAKALMNPRVTNWLLRAANTNTPQQAREVTRQLGNVIAREPSLAGELEPLNRYLTQALQRPVAASEADGEQDDR